MLKPIIKMSTAINSKIIAERFNWKLDRKRRERFLEFIRRNPEYKQDRYILFVYDNNKNDSEAFVAFNFWGESSSTIVTVFANNSKFRYAWFSA